jgi:hypothetical protein
LKFHFLYLFSLLKRENFFLPQTKAGRGDRDLPPPHCQALRALETSFAPGSSPGQAGDGWFTRPVFVGPGKQFFVQFCPCESVAKTLLKQL